MTLTYNIGQGSKRYRSGDLGGCTASPRTDSPTNKRCVYIPVETKDGTYNLTLTFTAKNAAGETLTETKGNHHGQRHMYEDDFTGNSVSPSTPASIRRPLLSGFTFPANHAKTILET
jgi:hypothetical protein